MFCTMDRILHDLLNPLRMYARTPARAADYLAEGGTDLIVIDLDSEHSSKLMHQIFKSRMQQKPTVLAVSAVDCVVPGVHVILQKPVTPESGTKSLKAAYLRMLRDYRKHTRFALMTPVLATDERRQDTLRDCHQYWGGWSWSEYQYSYGGEWSWSRYQRETGSREHRVFSGAAARIGRTKLTSKPGFYGLAESMAP